MKSLAPAALIALLALPAAALEPDPYWQQREGAVVHTPSGATCTPSLFGLALKSARSLNRAGTDAVCQYTAAEGAGDVVSIFVTDFGEMSFGRTMMEAERAAQGAMQTAINPGLSDYCDTALDKALAEQSARMGGIPTPEADCALLHNERLTSLLAMQRVGRWTVKARISTAKTGPEAAAEAMQAANFILQSQRAAIAKAGQ